MILQKQPQLYWLYIQCKLKQRYWTTMAKSTHQNGGQIYRFVCRNLSLPMIFFKWYSKIFFGRLWWNFFSMFMMKKYQINGGNCKTRLFVMNLFNQGSRWCEYRLTPWGWVRFEWNVSTAIWWIVIKFGSYIYVALKMNGNNFGDPLTLIYDQIPEKPMTFPSASVLLRQITKW